ncbi:hypothetical protein [Vibrio owensii]|uniref:hypothetical protein n=1 Tax=Vibrio owensii TaxID=696485 RepID=UPI003CC66C9D
MKHFVAILEQEGANTPIKGVVDIYTDQDVTLEDVIRHYEQEEGMAIGDVNRFGAILKEIVEVDNSQKMVIVRTELV